MHNVEFPLTALLVLVLRHSEYVQAQRQTPFCLLASMFLSDITSKTILVSTLRVQGVFVLLFFQTLGFCCFNFKLDIFKTSAKEPQQAQIPLATHFHHACLL